MRRCSQGEEDRKPGDPTAPDVGDCEHAQRQHRGVDREHGGDQPAVNRLELRVLHDDEECDKEERGKAEEGESTSSCAEKQLAGPGHEHREDARREPAACR